METRYKNIEIMGNEAVIRFGEFSFDYQYDWDRDHQEYRISLFRFSRILELLNQGYQIDVRLPCEHRRICRGYSVYHGLEESESNERGILKGIIYLKDEELILDKTKFWRGDG